jgi:transglutaminase-like putative cysteine protease
LSILVLIAWAGVMAVLVNRSYLQASSNLATDLARYGSTSLWRGVYYRGEKIGFTVSQTVPRGDGFDLEEDGRLQMALLGATTAATIRTTAHVDTNFALRAFEFSLDPGTGPIEITGTVTSAVDPKKVAPYQSKKVGLHIAVKTANGTRTEDRLLDEPPALSLNLSRRLANGGLVAGARHRWTVFDPATLHNAPVVVDVGKRELVSDNGRPVPAFRVEMEFSGLRTTSWVTDTGDVVREESPLGLITVREPAERARAMAVPDNVQRDMYDAAAVVPDGRERIDEPRDVRRLRVRLDGVDLSSADLDGVSQTATRTSATTTVEIVDPRTLTARDGGDPGAGTYLLPEPLIESDDPAIVAEARRAIGDLSGRRVQAERLTRFVNGLLEKKPTVSIPSAREVLRTRVGDCNEHTALFVAMARAIGIPSRIAVGLVFVRGAFYYHAWPEVYIEESRGRGLWLPVDPTLNQFPADATHLRLARGGLEKQAAILPLIGRLKMRVLDVDVTPGTRRVLAGASSHVADFGTIAIPLPSRKTCCACSK